MLNLASRNSAFSFFTLSNLNGRKTLRKVFQWLTKLQTEVIPEGFYDLIFIITCHEPVRIHIADPNWFRIEA